jgi:hypothetical protein
MWALAVIFCIYRAYHADWSHAISLFAPGLLQKTGPLSSSDQARHSQLHQVLLCMSLEGLWPGLDLAGLLGPDMVGLCRRAFEGAAVSSSTLQVRPIRSSGEHCRLVALRFVWMHSRRWLCALFAIGLCGCVLWKSKPGIKSTVRAHCQRPLLTPRRLPYRRPTLLNIYKICPV